ncbi:MAG: transglutaminase TgpA family protein [Acidimicrobiales bacterium]
MSRPRRRTDGLERSTELALAGVTTAAVVGMHLLFADGSFFAPLFWQAVVAHVTLAILRRREVRLLTATCIAAVVAVLSITWLQYLDTTVALLPSSETLSAIDLDLDEAWRLFQDVRAPAPVVPGFIVATSLAVWVIVFIADWGAFRTGVSFEAVLPPATLFLFAAVLGDTSGSRAPGAALFVGAALLFLLLHRTWRQEGTAAWAAVNRERGRWSMLTSGSALAALPVVASAILGPQLPGANDPPMLPWRDITDDPEPRVVISPLVDIRSRLVDQADVEVFTVETDDPDFGGAYWRLTALDTFEDGIWRSSYDTDEADGNLPRAVDSGTDTRRVRQTITILALDAIWLPAAHEPVAVDLEDSGTEVDYDSDSETLIVDRSTPTSDGQSYTVISEVPTWTADQLRGASAEIPEEVSNRYLQLPDDFSERIRARAQEWAGGAETRYDQALALMNELRRFPYDQSVQPGHSEDALEDFLFVNQRGYCEQFAGAFAAMARSLGIPARVAVGFTEGSQDAFEPTLWRVTGRQAHAWVEVYFEGFGWVTFEPTPERGPSDADSWLGISEEQAGAEGVQDPDPADDETGAEPVPDGEGNQPGPLPGRDDVAVGGGEAPVDDAQGDDDGFVPPTFERAGRTVGIGVSIYLVIVPLALVAVRSGRRLRARAPAAKVDLAWLEATEEAAESGVRLSVAQTVAERAQRIRAAMPEHGAEIDLVAQWVEQVNYAEVAPTPEQASEAARAASVIVAAAAKRQVWHRRVLRYLDVRRLFPQPQHARRSAQSAVRTT